VSLTTFRMIDDEPESPPTKDLEVTGNRMDPR
jgi:hypothetical protein